MVHKSRFFFQQHPFLMFYDNGNEEIVSSWVRKMLEQIRIMKRFPSDMSLASTSSSASGWSGISGHSSSKLASAVSGSSGQTFQYMDTSWLCLLASQCLCHAIDVSLSHPVYSITFFSLFVWIFILFVVILLVLKSPGINCSTLSAFSCMCTSLTCILYSMAYARD